MATLIALALTACSPTLDALRARRDKRDAIVPSSASAAATCIADAATRAGAQLEKSYYDAELAVTEVVVTFAATDTGGPAFSAWYELTPRDGKAARVVYSFDAQDPHREVAGAITLGPIKACGGDANR
jgi:hypothetical protein